MDIKEKLVEVFEKNKDIILKGINGNIKEIREDAFELFKKEGIPHTKLEDWRFTNISDFIKPEYMQQFIRPERLVEFEDIFKCDVPKLDTILIEMINGWYSGNRGERRATSEKDLAGFQNLRGQNKEGLEVTEDGVIFGSFTEGLRQYPDLFNKHYTRAALVANDCQPGNGLNALNTATANDGVFIYVPDNVVSKKSIQIVNIVYSNKDLIINQRNLFVVGKNSQIKIVVCDHSMFFNQSFVNSYTEIVADEDSIIEHNKLQNYSNVSSRYSTTDILQEAGSVVTSNTFTLHGGFTRNDVRVKLNGRNSEINLNGLYLMDRKQHVDNHTFIEHAVPECVSNEKYKGIIDDEARGVFSGKIYVKKDAQKTIAYQLNKNILLTDTATANSKPHLEIYADDVKCSHGATVGQLDNEAMFYLRSRGIGQQEARMLLMYAFAYEIIKEIKIEPLRERIDDLVARRLRGEMSRCNNCAIRCS